MVASGGGWPESWVGWHRSRNPATTRSWRRLIRRWNSNSFCKAWQMAELPDTLIGLQRALARGEWSVPEALAAQRERLVRQSDDTHCVVEYLPVSAADASAASGVLAGIALAHKDIFNLTGRRPGLGRDRGAVSSGLPAADAVDRLARQGATQLAALAMAEFACGATGANLHFPRCFNPLQAQAAVGGSSSGSAVAVSAGLTYGSLGTDTAGSVRIPAATCAVLGLKTTHGRVPRDGVFPLAPSLDSVGILTRSAADARQLLDVLAPLPEWDTVPDRPLRLRAWIPGQGVDMQVVTALTGLLTEWDVVQRLGDWPEFQTVSRRAETVLHAEAGQTLRVALREGTAAPAVRDIALPGVVLPPAWAAQALSERGYWAQRFVQTQLADCDLFLLPALADPVPDWATVTPGHADYDARRLQGLYRYMGFVNYLGLPAIVLPIAADARGLPISAQLVARPHHEHMLLAFAEAVQRHRFGGSSFTRHFNSGN